MDHRLVKSVPVRVCAVCKPARRCVDRRGGRFNSSQRSARSDVPGSAPSRAPDAFDQLALACGGAACPCHPSERPRPRHGADRELGVRVRLQRVPEAAGPLTLHCSSNLHSMRLVDAGKGPSRGSGGDQDGGQTAERERGPGDFSSSPLMFGLPDFDVNQGAAMDAARRSLDISKRRSGGSPEIAEWRTHRGALPRSLPLVSTDREGDVCGPAADSSCLRYQKA
jgi:hypothetical protein